MIGSGKGPGGYVIQLKCCICFILLPTHHLPMQQQDPSIINKQPANPDSQEQGDEDYQEVGQEDSGEGWQAYGVSYDGHRRASQCWCSSLVLSREVILRTSVQLFRKERLLSQGHTKRTRDCRHGNMAAQQVPEICVSFAYKDGSNGSEPQLPTVLMQRHLFTQSLDAIANAGPDCVQAAWTTAAHHAPLCFECLTRRYSSKDDCCTVSRARIGPYRISYCSCRECSPETPLLHLNRW